MRLLDHLALRADPLRPHWLANLGTLLNQYFRRDSRPNVRTKALAILSEVYNKNRSEEDLSCKIILCLEWKHFRWSFVIFCVHPLQFTLTGNSWSSFLFTVTFPHYILTLQIYIWKGDGEECDHHSDGRHTERGGCGGADSCCQPPGAHRPHPEVWSGARHPRAAGKCEDYSLFLLCFQFQQVDFFSWFQARIELRLSDLQLDVVTIQYRDAGLWHLSYLLTELWDIFGFSPLRLWWCHIWGQVVQCRCCGRVRLQTLSLRLLASYASLRKNCGLFLRHMPSKLMESWYPVLSTTTGPRQCWMACLVSGSRWGWFCVLSRAQCALAADSE